jgi:hypothetical protein
MEVVSDVTYGRRLTAPDNSRYALMRDANLGDTVIHGISKNSPLTSKPHAVGYSKVAGPLEERIGYWEGEVANVIQLGALRYYWTPVYLSELRPYATGISEIRNQLEASLDEGQRS